ncbi:MAG: site-2 protease family protein [Anaerolineae bacterium]
METVTNIFPNWHWSYLLFIPGLLLGFTVHELGHSLTAYFLGDTSQVKRGNITPNPLRHVSWLGTILFIFLGIGWPKPVRFSSQHFKDRYLDSYLVAAAGPAANLAVSLLLFASTAILLGILSLTRQLDTGQITTILFFSRASELASLDLSQAMQNTLVWLITFTNRIWVANFALAIVSLIPLPPFDGFTAALSLMGFMKERRINQFVEETPSPSPLPAAAIIKPRPTPNKKQTIADIHFKLGTEYHQRQQFDDAIARYRQAIRANAGFGPAYVNMGLAFKAKNQRNEAIKALRGATYYAQDEKSKAQAWAELHNLSAFPEATPSWQPEAGTSGSVPWTDIKPSPDWLIFWAGVIAFLILLSCPVGIVLTNLMHGGQ